MPDNLYYVEYGRGDIHHFPAPDDESARNIGKAWIASVERDDAVLPEKDQRHKHPVRGVVYRKKPILWV